MKYFSEYVFPIVLVFLMVFWAWSVGNADVLTGTPEDTDSLNYSYSVDPNWSDTELYGFRLCHSKEPNWPGDSCQDFQNITNPTGTFEVTLDWNSTYYFGGVFFLKATNEPGEDNPWVTSIDTFVTPPQPQYPGAPANFRIQIKVTWNEEKQRYDVRVVQIMN